MLISELKECWKMKEVKSSEGSSNRNEKKTNKTMCRSRKQKKPSKKRMLLRQHRVYP